MFKSTDGGATWRAANIGLPAMGISALAINPGTRTTLYAGTDGRGVFDIEQVPPACVGDCNNDHAVTIPELLTMVNVVIDDAPLSLCLGGDADRDYHLTVDEILTAVHNALSDCDD